MIVHNSIIVLDNAGTIVSAGFSNTWNSVFKFSAVSEKFFTPLKCSGEIKINRIGDNVKAFVREGFEIILSTQDPSSSEYALSPGSDLKMDSATNVFVSAVDNNDVRIIPNHFQTLEGFGKVPSLQGKITLPFQALLNTVYEEGDTLEIEAYINILYTFDDHLNEG